MRVTDFNYELPEAQIAQHPLDKRDMSKLMTIDVAHHQIADRQFFDIQEFFEAGDVLVFNDTKVIPARLIGKRETGAKIEVFLLKDCGQDIWEVLVKPGRKALPGTKIVFAENFYCEIIEKTDFGGRLAKFFYQGVFKEVLDLHGLMPLPPYIHEKLADKNRYQTVYAKHEGSVAAPTAGLHFTPELLKQLRDKGVQTCFVTLHVGIGTFRPVSVDTIEEHKMHTESFALTQDTVDVITAAKHQGKKVVAVGTTAIRTLESAASSGKLIAGSGQTDIFIYPGYKFRVVDAIITNFHLPQSTLLMLVSAYMGREFALEAYKLAVQRQYRFFSFGDAMFLYNKHDGGN